MGAEGEEEIIPYKRRAAGSGKSISRSRRIFFWMSVSGGGGSDGSDGAYPGECPPPPLGFGWDLRLESPLRSPSLAWRFAPLPLTESTGSPRNG